MITRPRQRRRRPNWTGANKPNGFTIIEVAIAAFVLAVGIIGSITALMMGFRLLETARNTALADQVLQSEIEDLRLKSWAQLTDVVSGYPPGSTYDLTPLLAQEVQAQGLTLALKVTDLSATYADTVNLLVTVTWKSKFNNKQQTRTYQTQYSKNGLSDYFVSSH